jgi:peptidoglycan/LPS O-acetylase OafA/YrhL
MISKASDFGRILGASAVFYYHVGIVTGFPLWQWGEYAVAFFIILSGVAYIGFSANKPKDFPSYRHYLVSRVRAIFPMFITINGILYLASFCYPSRLGRPFTFTEFLLSSAGLSQYFGYRYLSTVMWFIPFIIQVYQLLPVLVALLNRVSAVTIIVAAFATSLSLITLVFWLWPAHAVEICRNWSPVFRLPEVCFGVVTGRALFGKSSRSTDVAALVVFAILSLALATGAPHFVPQSYILALPWNGLVVTALIAVTAMAAAVLCGRSWIGQWLRSAGATSLPFFLTHGIMILFVFQHFGVDLLAWLLYFALCWGAAILFLMVFRRVDGMMRKGI